MRYVIIVVILLGWFVCCVGMSCLMCLVGNVCLVIGDVMMFGVIVFMVMLCDVSFSDSDFVVLISFVFVVV